MQSIAFTDKTEHIYARFQDMRRAYEAAHGRTYAPGFLTVLMDGYLLYKEIYDLQEMDRQVEGKGMSLLDLLNATKDLDGLTPDEISALDEAIEECKPKSE